MWKKKTELNRCGLKIADGTPCVLDSGHDPDKAWETREHKTADGTVFTWRSGQGAAEVRLMNNELFGGSGQI